ncbi:MAG: hypothetical protein R3F49_03165 [Planctomycetota bacterium]
MSTAIAGLALLLQAGLPPRATDAANGAEVAARVAALSLVERERVVCDEVRGGNVPESWRAFVELHVSGVVDGRERHVALAVAPDYLTVGSDADGLRMPLSPSAAQEVADALDCVLPTPRLVDLIYAAADVKVAPEPIPPSPEMTSVAWFARHDALVDSTLAALRSELDLRGRSPAARLVAGHKKDVVLTPGLAERPGRVAIYGWHELSGAPIQPLYLGHTATWVDYSHGARLIARAATLDGAPTTVDALLSDPALCALLSDAGPILSARYGPRPAAQERLEALDLGPGVRAIAQVPNDLDPARPTRLVVYALPNGSTLEQTLGRRPEPGQDWRFGIQHIGAQARWLRTCAGERDLVVVYLECDGLAWPTWLRKNDPEGARAVAWMAALRARFGADARVTLTGHSGGGALTFAFLDAQASIPAWVERIAFLDSNYRYDGARGHAAKLLAWLGGAEARALVVLAYDDASALLDGKPFVSREGGTWGRSHALLADLKRALPFASSTTDGLQRHVALGGRVQLLLKENPERAVLHTVQVERNGLIHALLAGTPRAALGYRYFGPRVYDAWIE